MRLLLLASLVMMALAAASAPAPRVGVAHPAPGVHFALDCAWITAGIQDDCANIGTQTFLPVEVSIASDEAFDLNEFEVSISVDPSQFEPMVTLGFPYSTDSGSCTTTADIDPSPAITTTLLHCTLDSSRSIPGDGTHVSLAHMAWRSYWNVSGVFATSDFSFVTARVVDIGAAHRGVCGMPGPPASCYGATFTAWDPALAQLDMFIDCDVIVPGLQDACPVRIAAPAVDVGVYVRQTGGFPWRIAVNSFAVTAYESKLDPIVVPPSGNYYDLNPDLAEAFEPIGPWACPLVDVQADTDPSPAIARSSLSCSVVPPFNGPVDGPFIPADGTLVQLGIVHYTIAGTSAGPTQVSVSGGFISDVLNASHGDCAPDGGYVPAIDCHAATLYLTDDGPLDSDGDGFKDALDACVALASPDQTNSDGRYDMTPPKAFDDVTRPNSDRYGDLCDEDDDNDGLSDATEMLAAPCPAATGATNPTDDDSDGDLVIDGVECFVGSDPTVPTPGTPPSCPVMDMGDLDGDGVLTFREICFYASNPALADTDGDGCPDGREVASVNGDRSVNSLDLSQIAQHFLTARGTAGYFAEMDLTKEGVVNSLDLARVVSQWASVPCGV